MAWRFSPCNPCCGCCVPFTGSSKWTLKIPANFADGIVTGIAAQFNGSQTPPILGGGTTACSASKGGYGPGLAGVSFVNYQIDCSGCSPPNITPVGTSSYLSVSATLQSGKAGDLVQFNCRPFSLSTLPSYVYPMATLEYALQADGCYFLMYGCAQAANQVPNGGTTAGNISWSQALWVLDGLDATAIQIGQTFTLPNRGIDGYGINTPLVCVNGPPGVGDYVCTFGAIWTGGFTNDPAQITWLQ